MPVYISGRTAASALGTSDNLSHWDLLLLEEAVDTNSGVIKDPSDVVLFSVPYIPLYVTLEPAKPPHLVFGPLC